MQEISPKIKTANQPEIQAPNEEKNVNEHKTKGVSNKTMEKYFVNLKP